MTKMLVLDWFLVGFDGFLMVESLMLGNQWLWVNCCRSAQSHPLHSNELPTSGGKTRPEVSQNRP